MRFHEAVSCVLSIALTVGFSVGVLRLLHSPVPSNRAADVRLQAHVWVNLLGAGLWAGYLWAYQGLAQPLAGSEVTRALALSWFFQGLVCVGLVRSLATRRSTWQTQVARALVGAGVVGALLALVVPASFWQNPASILRAGLAQVSAGLVSIVALELLHRMRRAPRTTRRACIAILASTLLVLQAFSWHVASLVAPQATPPGADSAAQSPGLLWVLPLLGLALTGVSLHVVSVRERLRDSTRHGAFLSRKLEELEALVHQDALTGLPNRVALEKHLVESATAALRANSVFAVVFMDLDGFKQVNDEHGHPQGDALLRTVSHRLQGAVREGDFIARVSGDEFVVVAHDAAQTMPGSQFILRLLEAVREPVSLDKGLAAVTASAGVALFPRDGSTVTELMRAADKAMYEAKHGGKNAYRVSGQGLVAMSTGTPPATGDCSGACSSA